MIYDIISVLALVLIAFVLYELQVMFVELGKCTNILMEIYNTITTNGLSDYELETIIKQNKFNDRIDNIKSELGNHPMDGYMYNGIPAEEVDGVYNIPHSIITDADLLGEEVAI